MSSEDRTTDSAEGAADQPSMARPVEEIRADLARAASPYYCGGGPVADRLATDAASLLSRLAAVEREAAEWRSLAEYAFHLAQYGERAPGGNETWREFERRLRTLTGGEL